MSNTAVVNDDTTPGTAVSIVEDDVVAAAIAAIANGQALAYSSLIGNDWGTKLAQLEAVTNSEPIRNHLGETIEVTNIIIQAVDMADEKTGVVSKQPRIILLDGDGNAFHAISQGLFRFIGNMIGIAGDPSTWDASIPIKVVKKDGKVGQYMTAEFANVHKVTPTKK